MLESSAIWETFMWQFIPVNQNFRVSIAFQKTNVVQGPELKEEAGSKTDKFDIESRPRVRFLGQLANANKGR